MKASPSESKDLFSFLKKHALSFVFIGGFIFDIFILPDVDHIVTILLGTGYVTLFALFLLLREMLIRNNTVDDQEKETYKMLTFGISFFSGSVLSYIFSWSLRSADFGLSSPFLFIFFTVLISNELISSHKFRLLFDYVLLVVASSFYIIYMMPLVTHYFDNKTLYVSIIVAAVVIYMYTAIFARISEFREIVVPKGNALSFSLPIIILFLSLNFLLPPVPFKITSVSFSRGSGVVTERKLDIASKIFSINESKVFTASHKEGDVLKYATIYKLPEGVKSSPIHVWYKKEKDGSLSLIPSTSNTSGGELYEIRSIYSSIESKRGEYSVVTRVGGRVIRKDTVIIY